MPDTPIHFFDLDREALRAWCVERRIPRFRADQLLQWVYERHIIDPRRMTDFSKTDRAMLDEQMTFTKARIVQRQLATDGTRKLLVEWGPRLQTECVMIPATSKISGKPRRTGCISSQVGCPVGCKFCASGLGGLDDNLTPGKIIEQVWWLNGMSDCRLPIANGASRQQTPSSANPQHPMTHVVFMGMGEPLSNFNAVTTAVRTLNAPWGFNLSGRRITISTVGLPAQIRRLADRLNVPITLAISLHAPNDALRRQLIPWASFTTIEQILAAGQYYFQKTGREVILEYILLRQVNDQPQHARELVEVAKTLRARVNLIRYNEVQGIPFGRPDTQDVRRFQQLLQQAGVNTHIRASRGRDIAAACGQLRYEHTPAPGTA